MQIGRVIMINILRVLRRVIVILLCIVLFFFVYIAFAVIDVRKANNKAASYCDLAVVGGSFEEYKKKVHDVIDEKAEFDDKKWEHTFRGIAPLAFGVALCIIKTDGNVIVSKEFLPTEGG
jgi:hypothetical protein